MIVLDNNALVYLYRPEENQEIEHHKKQPKNQISGCFFICYP